MDEYIHDQSLKTPAITPEQNPAKLKTPTPFAAKGASYLSAQAPLYDMPADAGIDLAAKIGNSAMLDLLVSGNDFKSINFSLQAPWQGKENRIKTSLPPLMDPTGLSWQINSLQPFSAGNLRERAGQNAEPSISIMQGAAYE